MELRTLDDLTEFEKLTVQNMSYSRMSTYDMCPAKFFYSYIMKAEQLFGPAAALGNVVHSVLEDTVGVEDELNMDTMFERFKHHRNERDPEGEIDDTLLLDGLNMLEEFVARHKQDKFDVIGREEYFEFLIRNYKFRGYIDLVTRNQATGRVRVTDYKSGKWEVKNADIPKDLQLGIYALAMSLKFPAEEEVEAELYYLRSGRRKMHVFTRADREEVYRRLLEETENMLTDSNFKATENAGPCIAFCDFARTKECRTGYARLKRAGRA